MVGEKSWIVYVHVNLANGKRYVGITSKKNPNHRWNSGRGYWENEHFTASITKYGWDNFEHSILYRDMTESEAKSMERSLISTWHTKDPQFGYNKTDGGDGTSGFYPSEETRKKLSNTRKRENLSEDTLKRRSESLRGRRFSDEHKRKIGDGNSKAIEMCRTNGDVIRQFASARNAEIELGISHSHISQCCHGTSIIRFN